MRMSGKVARQSQRPPGAGRATRADDVSSDSEEEDCAFDSVSGGAYVVGGSDAVEVARRRSQTAGRHVSERRGARAEMEAYAEKMRRRKLKGGKQAVAGVVEDETTEAARLEKRVVRLSRVRRPRWRGGAPRSQASKRVFPRPSPSICACHTPWLRENARTATIQARFRESGARSSGTTARNV